MPPKFTFDWFNAVKTGLLAIAAISVLWLNTNYASVPDLKILEQKVIKSDERVAILDEKLKSVVELINTKLDYIKRDTDEIKKKIEQIK
jgi:predicted transcriptional regulator